MTGLFSWHWIFLINVPVGVAVCVLSLRVLPTAGRPEAAGRVDVTGALIVTAALVAGVYGIVQAGQAG